MKRIIKGLLILALLTALFCALTATASAASSSNCNHEWKRISVRKKPTCTKPGTGVFRCTKCRKTKTDEIPALGHNWGKWKTLQKATCGKAGQQTHKCKRCGKKETQIIPRTNKHKYVWKVIEEATCGEDGYRQQVCSVCKMKYKKETIPATGKHTPVWKTTKEETCGKEGIRRQICKVCKKVLREKTIPATGDHEFGEWKTISEGNCMAMLRGVQMRTCGVCGYSEFQPTERLNHDWRDWNVTKEPTCEEAGKKAHSCRKCLWIEYEDIPPLGHDWDEGVVTRESTATLAGEITYTCKRDPSHTMTADIPVYKFVKNPPPELPELDPLVIVKQPVGGSLSYKKGGSVTLTVEADGGMPPYFYTWRRYNNAFDYLGTPEEMEILSSGSPSFTVTEGGVLCFCEVSDSAGNQVRSDTVRVDSEFVIVEQPEDAYYMGYVVYLNCRAAGGEPFEGGTYLYAWYSEEGGQLNLSDNGQIEVHEPGVYYCVIEDAGLGHLTTNKVKVTADLPFRLVSAPGTIYLAEGEMLFISAQFEGGTRPYHGQFTVNGGESSFAAYGVEDDRLAADITGSGKEDTYLLVASDDADGHAEVTINVLPQHLEVVQQPEGGTMTRDGVYTGLSVEVAGGEAPYTFTLHGNDKVRYSTTQDSESFGMPVFQAGLYYFEISDATGCTVRSAPADVKEWKFALALINQTGDIPADGGSATLRAFIFPEDVDEESVAYKWWYLGDETHIGTKPLSETGNTVTVYEPGIYQCIATSNEGDHDMSTVEVKAASRKPIIVKQPAGFTFAPGTQPSGSLLCFAEAYDGAENVINYHWDYRLGDGDWQNGTPGSSFPVPELPDGIGYFQCTATDVRTGEKAESQIAVVQVVMDALSSCSTGPEGSTLEYQIIGGQGPYYIQVFSFVILEEKKDGTLVTDDIFVLETVVNDRSGVIDDIPVKPYSYSGWEDGKPVMKKADPILYIIVQDSGDQFAASNGVG